MGYKDMSYMFPAYPIVCILSAILALMPIPSHYRAGNIGIIALGVWTFWGNIIAAVNTIYWHGNLRNPNPIWGDICQAYFAVMNFGLSSSTIFIQYTLWKVSRNRKLFITRRERRMQKIWGAFWCYGFPLLFVVFHYIVQGHRYDVVEDLGPTPTTYLTPVAFTLYFMWDPILCIIAIIFSILTYINVIRHRKEVANMFVSSKRHNAGQYYRLLAITLVLTLIHLPLVLRVLIGNAVDYEVYPWISWEDTHSNYMRIQYISRIILGTIPGAVSGLSLAYWAVALCGYIYFALYGTGSESLAQYKRCILYIPRRLGLLSPSKTVTTTAEEGRGKKRWSMPVFARRNNINDNKESWIFSSGGQTATGTTTLVPQPPTTSDHPHRHQLSESAEKLEQDETMIAKLEKSETGDKDKEASSSSSNPAEKKGASDLEAQRGETVVPSEDETEEVGF
ncbi:a-factor receptor [Serendipita sp. 399]|nr:a-factor receptor [Serendipita sp. 399]